MHHLDFTPATPLADADADEPAYLASLKELGAIWRERMGKHYPAMAVVFVSALVEDAALIEIETTAVLPN